MPVELIELIKFEATQEAPLQGYFELHWFDDEVLSRFIKEADMRKRFAVFGKSADGYPYALWLDDDNEQRVVYFMAGNSAYYLADSFKDFIILLSMGHFEEGERNPNFQPWIEKIFEAKIPASDEELMKDRKAKDKRFTEWMHANCEGF